ncbi:MAG: 50S ribosomal protein L6, partial [Bacteroidales bacterium]|nr:50S ribosomal protein L6 [Bacteroidales bacterium]
MSRIGRKPVVVPAGVEVTVDANNVVTVKGPKGQLEQEISKLITVEVAEGVVNVSRESDHRDHRAQHGLARTLIANMITGVTAGFEKKM